MCLGVTVVVPEALVIGGVFVVLVVMMVVIALVFVIVMVVFTCDGFIHIVLMQKFINISIFRKSAV